MANNFDNEELNNIKELIDKEEALGERTLEELLDAMQRIEQIRNKAEEAFEEAESSSKGIRSTIKLMREQQNTIEDREYLLEQLEGRDEKIESHIESIEESVLEIKQKIEDEVLPELEDIKGLTEKEIEGIKRANR